MKTSTINRQLSVYVLTPSFPPVEGGQENHLLELCEGLVSAGAAVQVFTRRVDRGFLPHEWIGSVPVRRLRPFGEIRGVGFRAAPRLAILLIKLTCHLIWHAARYDVVLVSGFNFVPMSAVVAGAFTGKPCVVRPESPLELVLPLGDASRRKMGLSEHSTVVRVLRTLRRVLGRRVDRYVAISSEIRALLVNAGIDVARIVAIPNGIAVSRFAPTDTVGKGILRTRLQLPINGLIMIYTGRLAHSKGIMMLIDAWCELSSQYPDGHLLVVGTGHGSFDDCETALRHFINAHGISSRVTLTGAVKNVHEYLQASDIFVFPSDYEGFSLSILEAMTAQLPLVSTRVGIAAELGEHCRFGLLVPPQDRGAFRDSLQAMLSDSALRTEMGAVARATVADHYSLATEAKRYVELFNELLANP